MLSLEYYKEKIKYEVLDCFRKKIGRLCTPMDFIVLICQSKGYWNDNANAIELFGMYGLWHTMDYVSYVRHIDFFEIEENYIIYARKNFKKHQGVVTCICGNSLDYISDTDNKYDLVVADTPYNASSLYDLQGLPLFFDDMLRIVLNNGIIIFNIYTIKVKEWDIIRRVLSERIKRTIKDIFVVPRNALVSYIVIVFGD